MSSKVCFAFSKCSEESSNALDGIHPTFRQVPPRVEYFSIITVLKPNCAHLIAATYPPGPGANNGYIELIHILVLD